jgi:bifunctional non-homologous end joining protein LigD
MPVGTVEIPKSCKQCDVPVGSRKVRLTNLEKVFWPEQGITKRDLLQYYADVSDVLIPHLAGRAMVMKRYPNGIEGDFFFMKRAPAGKPDWIEVCTIKHRSGNIIDFPIVNDLASLLWIVNLGCIDLNQWYAKCDDVDRPDYLHFDLDPVPNAGIKQVLEAALRLREALDELKMPSYPKTTGSKGVHIYVPIVRGPLQKQVWAYAKKFARSLAGRHSTLITAEYRVAHRPADHVLVDYNQNAWGEAKSSGLHTRDMGRSRTRFADTRFPY